MRKKPVQIENGKSENFLRRFERMSDAEKDEFVAQFDREIPLSETTPLSPAERAAWNRAKAADRAARKHESSVKAQSSRRIVISIAPGLLAKADRLAKAQGVSRSELFVQGIRLAIARKAG